METTRFEIIEAEKIVVGGLTISKLASGSGLYQGAGLWLTDEETGGMICIVAGVGQGVQVSLRRKDQPTGHCIALYANGDDCGVQVTPLRGKARNISLDKLIEIADEV